MTRIDASLREARAGLPAGEAESLLAHVLQRSRGWLYAHGDDPLGAADAVTFDALLARRRAGEPVAYLVGGRGFWRFDLQVTPATLIPRPETELLVEQALLRLPQGCASMVADLGTGSGAVGLAIASERPLARVIATDLSPEALTVARGNAGSLGLENIEFRHGDWWSALTGLQLDLVVSNPPYIAEGDEHLQRGDLRFEPRTALASGPDGLDAIRCIVDGASAHLKDNGYLLLEHGWDQGAAVRALLEAAGFIAVQTAVDLEQRDRVTLGRRTAQTVTAAHPRFGA